MRYRSSAIIVGQLLALLLFIASGFAVAETHDVLKLYDEKQYTVSKYIHVYHDEQDSLTIEDPLNPHNPFKQPRFPSLIKCSVYKILSFRLTLPFIFS